MIRSNIAKIKLYKKYFLNPFNLINSSLNYFNLYYLNKRGYPLNVNLLVTSKCNHSCVMCCEKNYMNKNYMDLSTDEIIKFLDDIKNFNPLLFITGGEPFIRDDIFTILKHCKTKKIHTGICTNGTLFNEKKIVKLAKLNLDNIIFSMHGTEKIHDRITGKKGNFQKLSNAIKQFAIHKKDTHVMISCSIQKNNYAEIQNIIKIAKKLPVDSVRIQNLVYITSDELQKNVNVCNNLFHENIKTHHFITDDSVVEISNQIRTITSNKNVVINPFMSKNDPKNWYTPKFKYSKKCNFLWMGIFVDYNGDVFPCQTYSYKLGNIKQKSLIHLYNSKRAKKFRSKIKKKLLPGCARCCKL